MMCQPRSFLSAALTLLTLPLASQLAHGQGAMGQVVDKLKISQGLGGFDHPLDSSDNFGTSATGFGDINRDGVPDAVVGVPGDDDRAAAGAVYVLFLQNDGSVQSFQKISATQGGLVGLTESSTFGHSVAAIGDLDGDGLSELAVGAPGDDEAGGTGNQGAVWILFLNSNGTVRSSSKINALSGLRLEDGDAFGSALAAMGDVTGDSIPDIAVGAILDDFDHVLNLDNFGSVYLLGLDSSGGLTQQSKIGPDQGIPASEFDFSDFFGGSLQAIGDLDQNGVIDLAVGAHGMETSTPLGTAGGAVWILELNPDLTVGRYSFFHERSPGFPLLGVFANTAFGSSLAALGDLDGNGVTELAVGAPDRDAGTVWVAFLNSDGHPDRTVRIGMGHGNFGLGLGNNDKLGRSIALLGDLDGDQLVEVIVGAVNDDTGGSNAGAAYTLSLSNGPWVDRGYGLAGTNGKPELTVEGTLEWNSEISILLENARPNTTAFLLFGFSEWVLPFQGGVMVPALDLIQPLPTGSNGEIHLNGIWPAAIPDGFLLSLQYWLPDPAGPRGFAASNGMTGTSPW